MSNGKLHIGYSKGKDTNADIEIPVKTLKRHFAALGASGSGKTVLVKAVLEECIREGIPLILIDIQGDLASMALMGDPDVVERNGTPKKYHKEVMEKAQVAIFTPASNRGIPLSMNPLKAPPIDMYKEDIIQAIDSVADSIATLLKYNTARGKGKDVHSYLYVLLQSLWLPKKGKDPIEVGDFNTLIEIIQNELDYIDEYSANLLTDKDKSDLKRQLKSLTIGSDSLIFNMGMPMDVEKMMTWPDKDHVPVNVIYLNTIRDDRTRMNFMADIANQTYNYMLRNPSEDVQLVLLFDELAGLVPPVGSPPTKKPIQLLLKQARKYGVSLLLATQNISDVDYKSLGQVGTWALGRLMAKQDIDKVRAIIEAISPAEVDTITTKLRSLKTGEFMLLSPDVYKEVQFMQVRWLVTNHTTLDDVRVEKVLADSGVKEKFEEYLSKEQQKLLGAREREDKGKEKSDEPSKEKGKDKDKIKGEPMEDYHFPDEDEENDPAGIPILRKLEDVPIFLDKKPAVISSSEISEQLQQDAKDIEKQMEKYEKDKKVSSEKVGNNKVYWSAQYRMDPINNIVGPTFIINNQVIRGEAIETVEKNIPRDFKRKREKLVKNKSELIYVPLWRIGAIREYKRKLGKFIFAKSEWVQEKSIYYINAVDGSIANYFYDKSGSSLYFQIDEIKRSEDVQTLPREMINEKMSPLDINSLKENIHHLPLLNRDEAINQMKKIIGGMVNQKIVPSIVWYPVFSFHKIDEDKEKKGWDGKSRVWVDGLFGTYYEEENSPIKKLL
jgi:hypothetical protein